MITKETEAEFKKRFFPTEDNDMDTEKYVEIINFIDFHFTDNRVLQEQQEELKHDQEKFFSGFSHPKDCEMCKLRDTPQNTEKEALISVDLKK